MNKPSTTANHMSIKQVFERANQLTKKSFGPMLQGMALVFVILFVAGSVFVNYFDIQSLEQVQQLTQQQNSVINIVITLVLTPFLVGLIMMGVSSARGQSVSFSSTFNFLSQSIMLAIAALMVSILVTLGLALLVLPGIYLYLTTKFVLPLMADKKLSPVQAIITSVKGSHPYVFHILLIMIVFAALAFLVFMTLGLALIWVGPLYLNVFGILYQDIFVSQDQTETQQPHADKDVDAYSSNSSKDTHFDA